MIVPLGELLAGSRSAGRAVPAFTVYDLASAAAVVEAAEERAAGLVLLVSSQSFGERSGPALVAGLRALADAAAVPACVQLDHERDIDRIDAALEAGAGAVMADGSALRYEDNVAFVTAVRGRADGHGAQVEAELGRIEGDEEVALAVAAGALTDPGQAADFMARTGAHCLAVSIGNVHGAYHEPPALDWERLAAVRAAVDTPLSLHGASGLAAADLRAAVAGGIAKVNVNTELREAWFAAVLEHAPELASGARLLQLQQAIGREIFAAAGDKLAALYPTPQEHPTP